MSEEKKAHRRFHFNLFDVVLVLLAILCIVGVWQRQSLQHLFEDEQTTDVYTISVEIRQLRDSSVQYLTSGTELYVQGEDGNVPFGTIVGDVAIVGASAYLPYYDQTQNSTTLVEAYYPEGLSTVKAVLNTHGFLNNGVFYVEGVYSLSVNQTLTVYSENADFEICVTKIAKVG